MKIKAKNKVWFAGLLILLASVACSLPFQATETPVVEETAISHTTEIVPTEIETEIAITEEAPDPALPIVYNSAEELVVLNALDGTEIMRLSAPEFGFGGIGGVSGNGVFYVDSDNTSVFRVGYDNVLQELLFLNPDGGYFEGLILPSPDGTKLAQGAVLSFESSGSRVQLKVVYSDGSEERILLDQTLDRPVRPTPLKWSADGEFLYYMNVIEGIEGFGGLDLYKVNIATNVSELIFADTGSLVSTSVSPHELFAARAVSGEPLGIMIRDLVSSTNLTITLPEPYKQAWQMVWAPDDSALLVTVGQGMWESDSYSVVKIDMITLEVTYLVVDDVNLLQAVAWQVPETIWFNDMDGTLWRMDSEDLTLTMVASNAWVLAISR